MALLAQLVVIKAGGQRLFWVGGVLKKNKAKLNSCSVIVGGGVEVELFKKSYA